MYNFIRLPLSGRTFVSLVSVALGLLLIIGAATDIIMGDPTPIGNCYDPPNGCQ